MIKWHFFSTTNLYRSDVNYERQQLYIHEIQVSTDTEPT